MNKETLETINDLVTTYQKHKEFSDKQISFLTSSCCFKNTVESKIKKAKENPVDFFDNLFKNNLKYMGIVEKIQEDFSRIKFDLIEYTPSVNDSFDIIEEKLSFSSLLSELDNISKNKEHGLDNNIYSISIWRKNNYNNWIIHSEDINYLSIKDFVEKYNLSEVIEVKESKDIEKQILLERKESLEEEIKRKEHFIKLNKEELVEIESKLKSFLN